jgi:hypothetical protein
MGFLSPMLLAGAALVAVPIVLHLVMRRQSREVMFPALRFVQQRRESNRRRMRLRHWLLLALRCLLVAGLAAALARPTVRGSGLRGKEGAPLAAALVVDNSPRMQYVHQNRSRLEHAAEIAERLASKLPEDALAAVCDLGRAASGFAPDLSAVTSRIKNLRPTADARALATIVVEAIQLVAEEEDRRQEVFVFTDLAAAQWNEDGVAAIEAALAAAPDVRIYIVDIGVAAPKNASLGQLELRRSLLRAGEPLHVETVVSSNLGGESPIVELYLAGEDNRLEKRDQRIVELDDNGQSREAFDVRDLPLGTHQGQVKLVTSDPLAVDNVRYFTVEVRPPARVLLLAERSRDARFVSEALNPSLDDTPSRFECETATFDQAGDKVFDEYQAILLLDPGPLDEQLWTRLDDYAAAGGGVGLVLGHNADFQAFNEATPQRLLPGKLVRVSRDETYLRPRRLDHPALAGLRDYADGIPWQICRVARYWQFEDLNSDAYVVAQFANGEPAILERTVGRGRLLTVATPFSDPLNPEGRDAWNVLLSPEVAWPFIAIVDQLVGYLAQEAEERLDYLAGEIARVRLGPQQQVSNYVLRMPDGQATGRVAVGGDELAVSVTDELGNYRLTAGGRGEKLDRGFSVNVDPNVSDLTRVDPAKLIDAFPAERVELADNLDEVEESINLGRTGRELYAWAIAMVAIVWGAEHVLANRFYRSVKPVASEN